MTESMFDIEIEAFMDNLDSMLGTNEGKYVAFKGKEHGDFWECELDCVKTAYDKWGNVPIFIRQVSREYQIYGKNGRSLDIFSLTA